MFLIHFLLFICCCVSCLQWKWNKSNNVSPLCAWLEFVFSIDFNNWIDDLKHCQTINTTQQHMLRDCKVNEKHFIYCWNWGTHQTKHSKQLICEQFRLSLSQQSFSTTQTHFLPFHIHFSTKNFVISLLSHFQTISIWNSTLFVLTHFQFNNDIEIATLWRE
jgi:hypothetical protein